VSLTITNVPARICQPAARRYTEEGVVAILLRQAEELAGAGTKVAECEYIK